MYISLGKKLSYDLNSYYWRVVMINKDNMMITIMIVKAVIKKTYLQSVSVRYLRFLSATQKIAEDFTGKMSNVCRYKLDFDVFINIFFYWIIMHSWVEIRVSAIQKGFMHKRSKNKGKRKNLWPWPLAPPSNWVLVASFTLAAVFVLVGWVFGNASMR